MSPMNTKLIHNVADAFWGSKEAGNFSSYEGKALAAVKIQDRTYLKECLGFCDFCWPITYSLNTSDNVGDPDLEASIFNAVTGIDSNKLETCGAVICNLQRSILLREGRMTPQDDYPAEYNFTEPLSPDRPFIVPGPDDQPVNVSGHTLDRDKFSNMLKEYYMLRGWDTQTGAPLAETLTSLGMDDVAAQLK